MKNLVILGSTGSIGTQALEVAQQAGYRVIGLAAARQVDLLEKQIREFKPEKVAMYNVQAAAELRERVADLPVQVLSGMGSCNLSAIRAMNSELVGFPFVLETVYPKNL